LIARVRLWDDAGFARLRSAATAIVLQKGTAAAFQEV
jgi:hypothetical protein